MCCDYDFVASASVKSLLRLGRTRFYKIWRFNGVDQIKTLYNYFSGSGNVFINKDGMVVSNRTGAGQTKKEKDQKVIQKGIHVYRHLDDAMVDAASFCHPHGPVERTFIVPVHGHADDFVGCDAMHAVFLKVEVRREELVAALDKVFDEHRSNWSYLRHEDGSKEKWVEKVLKQAYNKKAKLTLEQQDRAEIVGEGEWVKNDRYIIAKVDDRLFAVIQVDMQNCWMQWDSAEEITEDRIDEFV